MARYWRLLQIDPSRIFYLLATIALLLPAGLAFAQDSENYVSRPPEQTSFDRLVALAGTSTREVIDLNGKWQARREDKSWQDVRVPGAYLFEGEMEFKRSFVLDSSLVQRSFKLVAFGVNNRATFFVNDEFIGSHVGGHTSFSLEIDSQHLLVGQLNEIQVRVDNTLRPRNSIPLKHTPRMAFNYGGIFRDLFIVALPEVYVNSVSIKRRFDEGFNTCDLELVTQVRNKLGRVPTDSLRLSLQVELRNRADGRLLQVSDPADIRLEENVLELNTFLTVVAPKLWSPRSPSLYELRLSVKQGRKVFDEYILVTGFNQIEFKNSDLHLNGQRFSIAGVDFIEDFPVSGPSAGWTELRAQIQRIKDLGANAVRVQGPPPHPFFADICDELGLFLLEEIPLVLVPNDRFDESLFLELSRNYFKEVVTRDAHHPSVLAWGVGTDLSFAARTQFFLRGLRQIAAAYSDRPTYLALHNGSSGDRLPGVDFILLEGFGKEPDAFLKLIRQTRRSDQPLMCSYGYPYLHGQKAGAFGDETNGQGGATRLTPTEVKYQEIQASKLRRTLLRESVKGSLSGVFVHTLADWLEARPNLFFGTTEDPRVNTSGLVNLDQERRFAYEVITSELKRGQHIQIPDHEQEDSHPIVFPMFSILVILVFLFNFNRSRSLRGNVRRIFVYPHGFYMELKEKRKVSPFHTFLLSLVTCAVFGVIVAGTAYHLRQSTVFNEFLSLIFGSDAIKLQVIRLIWHPLICLVAVTIFAYVVYGAIIVFLKVAGFAFGRDLPLVQYATLVFWTSANFVWLLPIIPIYYRIVNETTYAVPVIGLVLMFIVWSLARLFRGMRVAFGSANSRVLLLCATIFMLAFSVLAFYYESRHAFFDYLPTYFAFATERYF